MTLTETPRTPAATTADLLATTWMVSSDSHIVEPPDLWSSRIDKDFRDRGPVVRREADGDWWYVDGYKTMSFLGIQTGDRFDKDPDELRTSAAFTEVRPAAYDPAAYLAENETDGVWASVIYPSQGLVLFAVPVSDVVSAAMRAYNDWLADFCAHDPARLVGVAMVNLDDPAEAVAELHRCRDKGLRGALVTVAPPAWLPFRSRELDPFWAAAQELGMPLSLHVATDRADPRVGRPAYRLDVKNVPPSVFVNPDFQVRQTFADLILSGVFERFPGLRVGSVEHEIAWIPHFLTQLDYTYTDRPRRGEWHRFADPGLLPSDVFRAHAFVSFQEDPVGMRVRDIVGVDTLMWGSDYPHTESTFPHSQEILGRILTDVPTAQVAGIVGGNAAALYGIDVPAARR